MKIALITDAWFPQVNGVVRTLDSIVTLARKWGHEVLVISPDQYRSIACPTYPEIRLAMVRPRMIGERLREFAPDAIHLATEGPLGVAARIWCRRHNLPFTTAYHTQFPEYVARRTGLSPRLIWPYIRWFHGPSRAIMASTRSVQEQLKSQRLPQVHHWGRGVDMEQFSDALAPPDEYQSLPRPIQLYVGRVAVEKNIAAFLESEHPGSKVVVGDGPALDALKEQFPHAHFLGRKQGQALARCYAGADVFVFPSKTDTFGLVIIEALACGTPVAAYPVTGPKDILTHDTGAMEEDLSVATARALDCRPAACIALAQEYSWDTSARQFLAGLNPVRPLQSTVSHGPLVLSEAFQI